MRRKLRALQDGLVPRSSGGWIAKDYPSYGDIGVEKEWAKWAEDVIVKNSAIH